MGLDILWKWAERDGATLMTARTGFFASLAIATAIGFGASSFLDGKELSSAKTDRDTYRDCRDNGWTVKPCPVVYKSRQIVTQRVDVPTPDPAQGAEITDLEERLKDSQGALRILARQPRAARVAAAPVAPCPKVSGPPAQIHDNTFINTKGIAEVPPCYAGQVDIGHNTMYGGEAALRVMTPGELKALQAATKAAGH